MYTGHRCVLSTQVRARVPDRIEQDEQGFDVMAVGNRQIRVDALRKPARVLLP
jgi:hypothetical protein